MVAIFPLTINKTDFCISFSFKNIRTMITIVNILKPYICHLFYIYICVCVCVYTHLRFIRIIFCDLHHYR